RRTRSLFSAVFVLLVVSIRRATTLAMAMEGRAFGRPGRTWRRRSTFAVRDVAAVVSALVVCVLAIVAAHVLSCITLVSPAQARSFRHCGCARRLPAGYQEETRARVHRSRPRTRVTVATW